MRLSDGIALNDSGRWTLKAHHPLRVAFARGLDLILPPSRFDGGPRPMTPGFSPETWSRIVFLEAPVCDGCGLPFPYDLGQGARCAACMARPRAFARARAACLYDDPSRDLILKLKHADRPDLGRLFALWLARAGAELLAEADGVVPVPLHPRRLFARRYNQAAEIARPLARLARRPYLPGVLVRRRATASQGGKSGRGRAENVRAAFAAPNSQRARIQGARLVLIDDVLTTGATAEACAKALLAAGARSVDLLAVARVREASGEVI
jgi:ComF family protein